MNAALSWGLLGALSMHAGAHVAIVAGLARKGERWRAALAFLLPPLAPVWGWRAGMRVLVYAWTTALTIYAIGVAVA